MPQFVLVYVGGSQPANETGAPYRRGRLTIAIDRIYAAVKDPALVGSYDGLAKLAVTCGRP